MNEHACLSIIRMCGALRGGLEYKYAKNFFETLPPQLINACIRYYRLGAYLVKDLEAVMEEFIHGLFISKKYFAYY